MSSEETGKGLCCDLEDEQKYLICETNHDFPVYLETKKKAIHFLNKKLNKFLDGKGKGLWSYVNLPDKEGVSSSEFWEDEEIIYKGGENIIYDGDNKLKYEEQENEVSDKILDEIFKILYDIDYREIFERLKSSDDIDFVLENYPDTYYKQFIERTSFTSGRDIYYKQNGKNKYMTNSTEWSEELFYLYEISLNKKRKGSSLLSYDFYIDDKEKYGYEGFIVNEKIASKFLECFKGKIAIDLGCGWSSTEMEEIAFFNGAKKYIGIEISNINKDKLFKQGENNVFKIRSDMFEFLNITSRSLRKEPKIFLGNGLELVG